VRGRPQGPYPRQCEDHGCADVPTGRRRDGRGRGMNARPDPTAIAPQDDVAPGGLLMDVRNVSLAFGGLKALTDISFDVRKGEIRAIIGPNGAGKTSMLNVINGFYTPQEGSIIFRGRQRIRM